MSKRAQWQAARRAAREVQTKRHRERAGRDKRLEDLAVRVLVAVGERDAAVADCERRAGQALREMTQDEGLTIRAAVEWCGDEITTREVTRLRRLVDAPADEPSPEADQLDDASPDKATGRASGAAAAAAAF